MNFRGFWAGASVLVSLALGAVVLSFLLDRPHPPEKPRLAAKPSKPKVSTKIPEKPRLAQAPVPALRLPPPPSPPKPKIVRLAPPPAPVKAPPRPKPAPPVVKTTAPEPKPPQPPKAKPKSVSPIAKRSLPGPPPRIVRKSATPIAKPRVPDAAKPRVDLPKPQRVDQATPHLPARQASAQPVVPTRATRREGRTLLRLLEYGKGPQIEIAWPDAAATRERLYRRFRECFGMRNAVMTRGGQLFGETGPAGAPLDLNLDRYSGFVRRPAGRAIPSEGDRARAISARHGIEGRLVRLFPRNVDAVILGGLSQVIGAAYRDAHAITARYRRRGGRLMLEGIRVNGRPFEGAVDVGAAGPGGCAV